MSGDERVEVDDRALRAENARLNLQLAAIVEALERRPDIGVQVDLDGDEPTITVHPTMGLPPEGMVEVREVAERLAIMRRDMDRLHQQVEKLLWRMGQRRPA